MKKLFLIASLLVGSVHATHAMEGMLLGAAVPAVAGFCYAIGSGAPVDQKIGQWALATGCGAAIGGLSKLALYALITNPATAAGATAFVAGLAGCGITGVWTLSNIMPTRSWVSKVGCG